MKKTDLLSIEGKRVGEIEIPNFFFMPIREDLIFKVLETKKIRQPYSPSPVAGRQNSASGIIVHRRHVWKSGYGRGISRVPRKIMTRKGSQFNWIAAEVPFARGGRRAHPPKILKFINTKKINKKENENAFISALSATANKSQVLKKYGRLDDKTKINTLPIIVENKITQLKVRGLKDSLKKILGEELFTIAIITKKKNRGKGKLRGRRYKRNAGALLVLGEKENLKTRLIEVKPANKLSVFDLASGGQGRLTLYTENAIKDLQNRLNKEDNKIENMEKRK